MTSSVKPCTFNTYISVEKMTLAKKTKPLKLIFAMTRDVFKHCHSKLSELSPTGHTWNCHRKGNLKRGTPVVNFWNKILLKTHSNKVT